MLRAPRFLTVVLPVLLCSCASQFQSDVFYTPDVDFSAPKNLAFAEKGGGEPANREIARKEIQGTLEGKGFRFTERSRADLMVHFTMGTRAKVRLSGRSSEGTNAGLVIEFVDPRSGRPLWHGLAYTSWFESMDPAVEIRKAVAEILTRFPPPAA